MASLVQSASPAGTSASVTSLTSTALGSTPTPGNLLVVVIDGNISGNIDPVYATPAGWTAGPTDFNPNSPRAAMFYKIAGASEPTTVTITWTNAGGAELLGIYEFSGVDSIEAAVSATAHGSSSSPAITGAAATTDGNEVVVAFVARTSLVTGATPTGGFTLAHDGENTNPAGTRCGGTFLYKILGANETPSTGVTLSGSADWATLIAAFKTAPSGITISPPTAAARASADAPAVTGVEAFSSFGHTIEGTIDDNVGADNKVVYSVVAPENGFLYKLTGYLSGQGVGVGDQVMKAVVYASDGFTPGALLAVSDEVTITDDSDYAWHDFDLATPIPISAGTTYWIGYIAGDVTLGSKKKVNAVTGGFLAYNANTGGYAAGPTDPFGSLSTTTIGELSLYGQYVAVGTADPPRVIPRLGVSNGFKILTRDTTDRQFEIDKCIEVGAQVVRIVADPDSEAELNTLVPQIAASGLKMVLVLYGTTAPISPDTWPTDQANAWVDTPEVIAFEIANEPDNNGWDADTYADFVADAYVQINTAHPGRYSVVAGALWRGGRVDTTGTATDPQHFTTALATRAFGKFDYLSAHLYDNPEARQPWNMWDYLLFWDGDGVCDNGANGGNCRQILDSYGLWNVPIISTESGGRILPDGSYTEEQVGDYVTSAFQEAAAGQVASVFVHAMMDDDIAGYGMLRTDLTKRPAWYSFLAAATTVRVIVEAAFGSYPSDPAYTWTQIHDSADQISALDPDSGSVRSIAWKRGLDDLIGRAETGTGTTVLRDLDRRWDPGNVASPYYPNVRPDLPMRARAIVAADEYPLFLHYFAGFPRRRNANTYVEVTAPTIDGFAGLALAAPTADYASLIVDPAGVNNTIVYTAVNPGMGEEDITIQYIGGPYKPIRVSVSGRAIEIRYHLTGLHGDPDNIAQDFVDAINNDPGASRLVTAHHGDSSDGTGSILTDFGPTNLAGADAAAFPQEATGARINRCLDQSNWPAALRAVDDGTRDVEAAPFASNEQGRLLSHVLDVAGEPGEFTLCYINGAGQFVFLDRNSLYTNGDQGTYAATFSDQPTAGQFEYRDSTPNYSRERVINEWVGAREGGVSIIVQDTDSIGKHHRSSHEIQSLLTKDSQVRASLEFGRDEYGQPVQALADLVVMPGANVELWKVCLGIDIGDRIRVIEHPPGGGDPNDQVYMVINLAGELQSGPAVTGQFTFGLWPVRITNFFVFNHPTYGDLNVTVLDY